MSYIRVQFVERDASGRIVKGSAAIYESVYVKTGKKNHCSPRQIERLGKVIWLSDDGKSGIFNSKTRGLVEYDLVANEFREVASDDARIGGHGLFAKPDVHTVFGDSYILLHFMHSISMTRILSQVFDSKADHQRFICHGLHSILKEGGKIACDLFVQKNVASYLADGVPMKTLRTDTAFFAMMGGDKVKLRFFKAYIENMRKGDPDFGKGCYVDSTPLPNEAKDNPFNALCSHGLGGVAVQTRLVLVLDEKTGYPVWYTFIPGNVLDINTVRQVTEDVQDALGISISSMVLDAGYVTRELIETCHIGSAKEMIARMPAKKGYPYRTLYSDVEKLLGNAKYIFVRDSHLYFGHRRKTKLFNKEIWAYVYVDKTNAVLNATNWINKHAEEYAGMPPAEQAWTLNSFGYFVLLSNKDMTTQGLLDAYFGRTKIESTIKTSKEYVNLLPLCKWNFTTISGKILLDIIDLIIYLQLRARMSGTKTSITELFGSAQSLMCHCDANKTIKVDTPNKQVKQLAKALGAKIPAYIKLPELRKMAMGEM